MQLSPTDGHDFIELHASIMLFAGKEKGVLPQAMTIPELLNLEPRDLLPHRNRVYDDISVLDRFLKARKTDLTDQMIADIEGFRHYHRAQFLVMKHYRKYTVLMDDAHLYGVLGVSQPLSDMVPKQFLPAMVETVLIAFRGQLTYDGLLQGKNVGFGSGLKRSLNEKFKRLKALEGIRDGSHSFGAAASDPALAAEQELRYLMNSVKRWDEEGYRVNELRNSYPSLENVYYECASKLLAKREKKALREIGVTGRYFAVYFDCVLASAKTRKALMKELKEISFNGRVEDCAVFRV